jgi:hypothetical protein
MICILNILFNHPVSETTPNSEITGAYPPPLPRECKDLLFPSPFYMCQFTSPPPHPPAHLGEGEVGPSRGLVFGWRGERGETGVTPPHAGW